MNKKHQITLSIPQPCLENWDKMTPTEKGRHCASCNKTVVDFSNYTDKELVEFFKNNTAPVCGRLHNYQINRELLVAEQPNRSFFYRLLYGTALASWLGITFTANAQTIVKPIKTEQKNKRENQTKDKHQKDSVYVRGVVYDVITKQAIPFANVVITGTNYTTLSNIDGEFYFLLPPNYIGQKVTISLMYIGYYDYSKEIEITKKGIKNMEISMKVSMSTGLTQVTISCPKPFDRPGNESHDRNDSPYLSPNGHH